MSIDSHLRDFDYQHEESKLLKEDHYVTIQSVMNFVKGQKVKFKKQEGIVEGVSMTKRTVTVSFVTGVKELKPIDLEILGDRYYKHWTVGEMNYVRENRHMMDNKQLATHLGRTEVAIINFKRINNL